MIDISKEINAKIEKLRQEMVAARLKYNSSDHPKVIKLSLELDNLINIYTKFYDSGLYFYS
ncbi:aspartyl-phosphate phosphatase Spo0E family protein [Orenia marismortui]|uniref:Spo0E like sporulation regulatory protein n=1 Tax=Orenia marismortui TaxID=46469 RepID=A0A4R8H233_9FIRM|nr:aspartyl-phosphate phosphatase Spo0E family protein [Orenia marismortui]TDX52373.1 Spo0E like sporulation regulatory protein [Orenia marismortui]